MIKGVCNGAKWSLQAPMMADPYAAFGSMGDSSFFGNQGQYVEPFAPITPIMDSTGQAIGYANPRQQHTPYDMSAGTADVRISPSISTCLIHG